jgi:hypothetical protein
MSHAASLILAEVAKRLADIHPVYVSPPPTIPVDALPAIFLEDISDEVVESLDFGGPLQERRALRFAVFGCIASTSALLMIADAGYLCASIEATLLANEDARTLGGLCRPGLNRLATTFRNDSESLQRPVGGWSLQFECQYHSNTGTPV